MVTLKDSRKQHLKVNQTQLEMNTRSRGVSPLADDFEGKLVAAKQELEQLQHQQEVVERQKQELEELTLRKEEFLEGQNNITDKLASTITSVDRELFEMHQEIEDLEQTRKCFADHQQKIDSINPESWPREELKIELNRAISMLDHAEDEYDEALSYFSNSNHSTVFGNRSKSTKSKSQGSAPQSEFGAMFKQGLAFNLPIFTLGSIALIVYLTR